MKLDYLLSSLFPRSSLNPIYAHDCSLQWPQRGPGVPLQNHRMKVPTERCISSTIYKTQADGKVPVFFLFLTAGQKFDRVVSISENKSTSRQGWVTMASHLPTPLTLLLIPAQCPLTTSLEIEKPGRRTHPSLPFRIMMRPFWPPTTYSASTRNLPELLTLLCAIKAVFPSLHVSVNSETSGLFTSDSNEFLSQTMLYFLNTTTRAKPLLLSTNRRNEPPSSTESLKALAST